jgi:hypothetical protein
MLALLLSVLPAQPAPALEPLPLVRPAPALVEVDEFPKMEYTYIEASYVYLDSDQLNDKLDGWDLTGSLELPMNFFLQASVRQQSADADFDQYKIGAGWHFGLIPRLDAYGILSYQDVEVSGSGSDYSDTGAGAEVGLRFSLLKKLELNGRMQWSDLENSDTSGGLGARWYLTERFSLGVNIDHAGNDDLVSAGLRFEL